MWSKVYLAVLAVSIAVVAFFTYYSWSWLQSIGSPAVASNEFDYYFSTSFTFLEISSGILLIIANIILWQNHRAWAIWATSLYFGISVIIRSFWLLTAYDNFAIQNSRETSGPHGVSVFLTIVVCLFSAAVAFCDQFVVLRLREKMYPPTVADEPEAETESKAE